MLSGNGTGGIVLDNFKFANATFTNTVTDSVTTFNSTGTGYYKFAGTGGVVIPTGNNTQRPASINAEDRHDEIQQRGHLVLKSMTALTGLV